LYLGEGQTIRTLVQNRPKVYRLEREKNLQAGAGLGIIILIS
jgi:hypothetical protein